MLACVCADAETRLRLLRAIVGALAAQCIDLNIYPVVEEYTEDSRVAHYHAVWCAVLCDCVTACFCRAATDIHLRKTGSCRTTQQHNHTCLGSSIAHCNGHYSPLLDAAVRATHRFIGLMLGEATMQSALLASGLLLDILPLLEGFVANHGDAQHIQAKIIQAIDFMCGRCLGGKQGAPLLLVIYSGRTSYKPANAAGSWAAQRAVHYSPEADAGRLRTYCATCGPGSDVSMCSSWRGRR
jgi:hypothetical protein